MINVISIHAAREGGDRCFRFLAVRSESFQSTPPVKAATSITCVSTLFFEFQSTPPVKAATPNSRINVTAYRFQSTPPVKAATVRSVGCVATLPIFQSTPPVKAATPLSCRTLSAS